MPKGKSSHSRTRARGLALQVLYETDVSGHSVDASFGWLKDEAGQAESLSARALELTEEVIRRRGEIDEFIQKFAPAWPIPQLPAVDRNILRLALFEILFESGTPHKVAINEAVELAKTFGSESSARFVNGVLGSVMDELEWSTAGSPAPSVADAESVIQEWK